MDKLSRNAIATWRIFIMIMIIINMPQVKHERFHQCLATVQN